MKTLEIKFGNGKNEKINVRILNMENKHVIAPFFLACSHYYNRENMEKGLCDKGELPGFDGRGCCNCNLYDGGSIIAMDWGDGGGINFILYPFKNQYSLEEMEQQLKIISERGGVEIRDVFEKITIKKYEIKNPS